MTYDRINIVVRILHWIMKVKFNYFISYFHRQIDTSIGHGISILVLAVFKNGLPNKIGVLVFKELRFILRI